MVLSRRVQTAAGQEEKVLWADEVAKKSRRGRSCSLLSILSREDEKGSVLVDSCLFTTAIRRRP